jgi:hypothetical protein
MALSTVPLLRRGGPRSDGVAGGPPADRDVAAACGLLAGAGVAGP